MTNSEEENTGGSEDENTSGSGGDSTGSDLGISDDKLPEDLQPSEDNPLAEGLDAGETVEGLMDGGKTVETDGPSHGSDDDTGSGDDHAAPEDSDGSDGAGDSDASDSSDDDG